MSVKLSDLSPGVLATVQTEAAKRAEEALVGILQERVVSAVASSLRTVRQSWMHDHERLTLTGSSISIHPNDQIHVSGIAEVYDTRSKSSRPYASVRGWYDASTGRLTELELQPRYGQPKVQVVAKMNSSGGKV